MLPPYRPISRTTRAIIGIIVVTTALLPTSSGAQSLTDALSAEPTEKLLLDAQERGDIVRGAILFHQGNIACAKCHRPVDENDRIGPNLSRLETKVTDGSIIQSILHPSKEIAKEYQSSTVLDLDGKVYTGVIVKQNDQSIVLRDMQDVTKMITIDRQNIDQIASNPDSIMPKALADQLKNRQQFLDLLRYVLDLKNRGAEADIANSSEVARRELSPEHRGLVAFRKYNCGSCHADQNRWSDRTPPNAPDLRWSIGHVDADYLVNFIAEPQETKPGTSMPQMMPRWDVGKRKEAAAAIVAYLSSLDSSNLSQTAGNAVEGSTPNALPASGAVDAGQAIGEGEGSSVTVSSPASIERGQAIFHEVGCVACHSPRDSDGVETPLEPSSPLGALGQKYLPASLVAFLEDPLAARPHGLMPSMRLTHREAIDVSAFLLQNQDDKPRSGIRRPETDAEQVKQGQQLFRSLNCNRCHTTVESDHPGAPIASEARLNPSAGCLADQPTADSPQFHLSSTERSDLRASLGTESPELSDQQKIDLNVTYFNCTACHTRNDLGGVTSDRRVHFQTTNLNLGEQGRIPPTLTGVGAKLKRPWMRDVLVNGRSVRPYMKTRMPQFGEANIGHLIDLFQSTDELQPTEFATFSDQKETRIQGMELAGNKGLNCVACHTYQFKISDTMPAVDLTEMAERLEKDWFYQYMLAPQKFSPGTVMPSFWPNGKAIRPDLKGTPEDQVEALWQYLIDGRQARAPRGVIREPLEIVVTDEARMLRRSYPGIGKRGIGVGYPGGINLAFDAEQLRLATVWKGGFVDPSGAWYGQGHGKVRALGKPLELAPGPEVDDANSPWIVDDGRPPFRKFHGYTLGEKRRPLFRYSFGEVEVEDYFTEMRTPSGPAESLRRVIELTSKGDVGPLSFRLLSGPEIQIQSGGKRVTDGRLKIQIVSDHSVQRASVKTPESTAKQTQAFIPLELSSGAARVELEYSWE